MTRIAVTGSTGFIGSRVVSRLIHRGFEVHSIGRIAPDDREARFHRADLFDQRQVDAAIRASGASHLLHLAWYAEPGSFWQSPKNLDWVSASINLVRSFSSHGGIRAVLAGTCAEYQWGPNRLPETSCCIPATLYGAAKDAFRRLMIAYGETAPLSTAWGRVFFLYGPQEKRGRLVSDAIGTLLDGAPFLTTPGLQMRDYLHVDDVAEAFVALTESDVVGAVNIASGTSIPIRSILEEIALLIGRLDLMRFGSLDMRASEPAIIEADVARLVNEVGFKPIIPLAQGLKSTVDWWRAHRAASRLDAVP